MRTSRRGGGGGGNARAASAGEAWPGRVSQRLAHTTVTQLSGTFSYSSRDWTFTTRHGDGGRGRQRKGRGKGAPAQHRRSRVKRSAPTFYARLLLFCFFRVNPLRAASRLDVHTYTSRLTPPWLSLLSKCGRISLQTRERYSDRDISPISLRTSFTGGRLRVEALQASQSGADLCTSRHGRGPIMARLPGAAQTSGVRVRAPTRMPRSRTTQ